MSVQVARLRAELRHDSALVATPTPRLSWAVADAPDGWVQSGAEVRRGTEVVVLDGAEQVLVAWPFAPLAAGERCAVEVRVSGAGHGGEEVSTGWSAPLDVEAAFLAEGAWTALPVGLADPAEHATPALLRHAFTLPAAPLRAVLRWTALGTADPRVNGAEVDDTVLGPGWTSYQHRLVHETVDVTDLLVAGENVLAASLAGCWFTESYGFMDAATTVYGSQPRFLARLEVDLPDGSRTVIETGPEWHATGEGPIVSSGLYAGEHHDARRALPGWDAPGYDEDASPATWSPVTVGADWGERSGLAPDAPVPTPEARVAPPVRRLERVAVVDTLTAPDGGTILDFGQNLVGRLRLTVAGEAGTELVLRHAEVLEDGDLALRPLRAAVSTDTYVLAGADGGETWEPAHTFHGFRYARVDGWPGDLAADAAAGAVVAVVLASDLERTGWFSSGHALLDRFHENVVQGMRGNFLAIPTDCPQRDERLGWTGDIGIFAPTAAYLADCDGFLVSWLRDLALEQAPSGDVPMVVPAVLPSFDALGSAAAWADAATLVPWALYERFGDVGVLADAYPSMRAWVDREVELSLGQGTWTGQMQLGDWLDPTAPPENPAAARCDGDIVASAYLARSLRVLADTAAVLGHDEDGERYAQEADRTREAFEARFVTHDGLMTSDAPTAYALALRFDLVLDARRRQGLSDRLAELVRRDGYRIGTGFVGTPLVADALVEGGHVRQAARLLLQTECPSWLYPVTMGATTVWERWDSMLPDGSVNPGEMTSFNHYALGAVADFCHRVVAGLAASAPGYRRLHVEPHPLPGLPHATARHLTPYGPAEAGWRREGIGADAEVVVEVVVPPGVVADVVLPDGCTHEVASGTHVWRVPAPEEPAPRGPYGLDSPTSAVIDDPRAYAAMIGAIAAKDPGRAEAVKRATVWTERRPVIQALVFIVPDLIGDVAAALAQVD
ncbi:alpha-L-rhamnosidase [Nocardioides sp. GY 10127]|uniref:alpha-L-rhamnosidase n=1 Tax=Nocardioides sp. GY 10127 TaxID=2569762 RepID=UPI0010A8BA5D|nr:alpha-L-rhamnosidase [Nocardioides sp. GY 10127]TIC85475.1 alpha-L-rhamnosidase [Nocardioides sp. GY 10127]